MFHSKISQKQILPRPRRLLRVILDILDHKGLLDGLDEMQICPSALLEAEVADGVGSNEVSHRLL